MNITSMSIVKKLLAATLAFAAMTAQADPTSLDVDALIASQERTFVHVDRCAVDFEVPPVIVNSRTFVEVSSLANRLDIALVWRSSDQRITGTASNGSVFHIYLGRTDADINGVAVTLDAAPFIANPYNRTMIPLSFVAKATGARVVWRGDARTVDVFANKNKLCALTAMHRMTDFTFRGYLGFGEAGPIGITKATLQDGSGSSQAVYLVGLSGTDVGAVQTEGSATGIWEDFLVGFFDIGNAYENAAVSAIYSQVPSGSKLVFAGHSLGGMIAQQLAADPRIKTYYQVLNTVTFGSPLISALSREGDTRRMGDSHDVVPFLSNEGLVLLPWQVAGLNQRDGGYSSATFLKAHLESYRRRGVWDAFDVLGYENGTHLITFYPSDLHFYAAPR